MTRIAQLPGLVLVLMVGAALVACGETRSAAAPTEDGVVRVGIVLPPAEVAAGAWRGAEMGALEATRAGELIGRGFELLTYEASTPAEARQAARSLASERAFAIVGGGDAATCRELGAAAAELSLLFLNVLCREDSLRVDPPTTTFHVQAPEHVYAEAGAREGAGGAGPTLWHAGLERFGAAQLNERFERRFGLPADGDAWAAWMAIKVLWESANRTGSTDPARLAAYLLDDATAFDGHKGQSLTFGAADHQLRQPLYVASTVEGTAVPVEVDPLTGEAAGMTAEEWAALEGRDVPPGRQYLAVTNEGSGDVVIVDLQAERVVSRVRVGSRPRGIRVAPEGGAVYVALSDDAPTVETDEDAVAVIDIFDGEVVERFPVGTDPEVFDLSPDGRYLYASNEDAGTATITDLSDQQVVATLPVGIEPEGVATSADGRWVYVTAETSNTVSVIDTRVNDVIASFLVDVRPRAAAFSPTLPRAYVTNEISATLTVVDTDTHTPIEVVRLPEGSTPVGIAVSPDGRRVYVANGHENSVSVIDAGTHRVVAVVPVGRRPWGIMVSPDGTRVFTANGLSNDVSVINTERLEVVSTIPVGQRPWGVAFVE